MMIGSHPCSQASPPSTRRSGQGGAPCMSWHASGLTKQYAATVGAHWQRSGRPDQPAGYRSSRDESEANAVGVTPVGSHGRQSTSLAHNFGGASPHPTSSGTTSGVKVLASQPVFMRAV